MLGLEDGHLVHDVVLGSAGKPLAASGGAGVALRGPTASLGEIP